MPGLGAVPKMAIAPYARPAHAPTHAARRRQCAARGMELAASGRARPPTRSGRDARRWRFGFGGFVALVALALVASAYGGKMVATNESCA